VQRGFTLIELAIVLVIIGLLVGGVLVGRDLIQSAGINAVARDIDSYNVGAMTFRDKYGGIPGDITASKAQQFGLTISATNPGTTGEGDGDGVLGRIHFFGDNFLTRSLFHSALQRTAQLLIRLRLLAT
jgi:prepilin-type N-terminal cleavage/methylation domain-containing protein